MRTVRRLLYRDIVWSVVFVAVAFLGLFFFIDLVDELENIGKGGYTLGHAALRGMMELPGHFYELFPIAVLIGTIYAMARLAQSSEFTILRTAGLGPGRALALLALPGLVFALLTFVPAYALLAATGVVVSRLAEAPWQELLFQAGFQGIGSVVISGITFTQMVRHFGPVRSTMITSLVPGLSALGAVLFLGEPLHLHLVLGLALVTLGIVFGVRGPSMPPARGATITPAR